MVKSKIYSWSKQLLDKNQRSKFCQSSVKQTHFQNPKKKKKWFFLSQGHFKSAVALSCGRQTPLSVSEYCIETYLRAGCTLAIIPAIPAINALWGMRTPTTHKKTHSHYFFSELQLRVHFHDKSVKQSQGCALGKFSLTITSRSPCLPGRSPELIN